MTAVTGVTVGSPAESAAASLCWLARYKVIDHFHGDRGIDRIGSKVENYWHDKPCRFCRVPMEELMAMIEAANASIPAETVQAFARLDRNVRTAKVREAQEESWLDELTRAG